MRDERAVERLAALIGERRFACLAYDGGVGRREVRHDVHEVALAALVGGAVPLHESPAERELVAPRPALLRRARHGVEPLFHQCMLLHEARAVAAQPFAGGKDTQQHEACERIGVELDRQRPRLRPAPVPCDEPRGQRFREQARELGHARAHVIVDAHDLAVACPDLAAHPGETRCARLQRRDTHDVVERHPQGEEPRRFARQRKVVRGVRIARVLRRLDARDARGVQIAVRGILEIDDAIAAERDHLARLLRQLARCGFPLRRGDPERKPREARPRSTLVFVDHRLANRALPRQHTATGNRAEHDRAHCRAGVVRGLFHVEGDDATAERACCIEQPARVEAAVAERHLLGSGQGARGGRHECGAVGAYEAVRDHAARLQQLGRDDEIDASRHGIERQHRRARPRCGGHAKYLDVVRGGARPLRNARNGRALHHKPGGRRGVDDPLRKDAPALAAERADENRKHPHARRVPHLAAPRGGAMSASGRPFGAHRLFQRCIHPIALFRTRATSRSGQRGL